MRSLTRFVARLFRADAPLTATGLLMLVPLVAAMIGLAIDPRTIGGAPAWLKPAKFAASIAIFTLTLAWIFTYLPDWKKTRRWVGRTTATALALEMAIITAQACRGTTSHFNLATPLDAALWITMGLAIVVQTLASVAVAVALWRQRFEDRALGWALRLGLAISILGASSAGFMTRPTEAQLADARAGHRMTVAGAHTVGAPDGGPGLPGTGWSLENGDLRIPHFVGLHALQAIPLIALALRRRPRRLPLTLVAAASYTALFVILLSQALRGQALLQPDAATMTALLVWAAATVATFGMVAAGASRSRGLEVSHVAE
jgi:hypothetical protein